MQKRAPPQFRTRRHGGRSLWFSWQTPGSHGFAKLFNREKVGSERLTIGELYGSKATFGIEKIEEACGAAPVGVFADIAVLLRLVEVTRAIEADDLVVRAQILKGIPHIGQHLPI